MAARILVVDDDPTLVGLLTDILTEEGHAVAGAGDGDEALALIPRLRPDLLLTDLMMPRLSGLDLIRRARLPAILLTAGTPPPALPPRTDLLTKPFDLDALLALVAAHLDAVVPAGE